MAGVAEVLTQDHFKVYNTRRDHDTKLIRQSREWPTTGQTLIKFPFEDIFSSLSEKIDHGPLRTITSTIQLGALGSTAF